MQPIENYENVEAKNFGEFEKLELGGHVCIINKAYIALSTMQKEMLCLELEISNGKQAGFFKKQFDENTKENKKWGCIYRQLTRENPEFFKGMITAIENSNPGYKFNWDENTLVGKLVGGVFGLEEYTKQDGTIGTATKCVQLRSIDKIKDCPIPKVKMLNGTRVDYNTYMETTRRVNDFTNGETTHFDETDMPF